MDGQSCEPSKNGRNWKWNSAEKAFKVQPFKDGFPQWFKVQRTAEITDTNSKYKIISTNLDTIKDTNQQRWFPSVD